MTNNPQKSARRGYLPLDDLARITQDISCQNLHWAFPTPTAAASVAQISGGLSKNPCNKTNKQTSLNNLKQGKELAVLKVII